jgi:TolB protein
MALAVLTGLLVPAGSAWATFPGRNGKIVYTSLDDMAYRAGPTASSIRTVDPRSGRVRVVRDCPLRTDEWRSLFTDCSVWGPRYSPRGRRLGFLTTRTVTDTSLQPPWRSWPALATMAPDGRGLDEHPTAARYWELAWSPGGTRFLISRPLGPEGPSSIFLASLDGTELSQVTPGEGVEPDWASTGEIAFTVPAYGPSCYPRCANVYLTRLGGSPRRLTYRGGGSPSWSPHGTKLAFVRIERAGRTYRPEMYVVGREGGRPRHLTNGQDPTWSPDGRWIAYLSWGDVYVIRSAGGRPRRVLDIPPRGPHPSIDVPAVMSLDWQPRPLLKGKP